MNKLKQLKQKINKNFFNASFFLLLVGFLPTQFGKHFFIKDSFINGIRVDYLAPTIYLTDIIIGILIILNWQIIIKLIFQRKIFFILLIFFINIFFSHSKFIALYKLIKIFEIFLLYCIAKQKFVSYKKILIAFSISGSLILILTIMQMVQRHSIQGMFYYFGERYFSISTSGIAKVLIYGKEIMRPYATFSHPNSLAGFYLLVYVFILTNQTFRKFFLLRLVLLSISGILILLSFSKIAIAAMIIIFLTYQFQQKLFSLCKWCTLAKLLIFIPIIVVFFQANTDVFTIQKRIELSQNAIIIIQNNPIVGAGIGNYLIAQKNFYSKFYLFYNQPVHNIFLLYFAELGILLGGILIFILKSRIVKFIRQNFLVCFAIIFTGLFDHYWFTLQQNMLLVGVVLGLLTERLSLRAIVPLSGTKRSNPI